jgi:hypothetical protein
MTKEEYSKIVFAVRNLHDTWFKRDKKWYGFDAPQLSERDLLIAKRVIQDTVKFIHFPPGSQFSNQQLREDLSQFLTWGDFVEPEKDGRVEAGINSGDAAELHRKVYGD